MYSFSAYTNEIYLPSLSEKRKAYARDMSNVLEKHVYPSIGVKNMESITPRDIYNVYLNFKNTSLANPTIASYCRMLYREFCFALDRGDIKENPYTLHFSNNTSELNDYPKTLEEHKKLMGALGKLPLKGLFTFSYLSGITISSLRLIKISAYDKTERTLKAGTKTLRIPKTAYEAIDEEMEKRDSLSPLDHDFLFTRPDGSHIPQVDCYSSTLMLRSLLSNSDFTASNLWEGYGSMLRATRRDDWS